MNFKICTNIFSKNIFQKKSESPEQAFNALIKKPGILVNKQKREQTLQNVAKNIKNKAPIAISTFLKEVSGSIKNKSITSALEQMQKNINRNKSNQNIA